MGEIGKQLRVETYPKGGHNYVSEVYWLVNYCLKNVALQPSLLIP